MQQQATRTKSADRVFKMTFLAVFAALAYISVFVFRIKVSFLTFDLKDAITTIAAMTYGPLSAVMLSALIAFLEFFTLSDTGVYGMIMNFISSLAFSGCASLVYKYKRNMAGAIGGLGISVVATTAVMMVANLLITPHFMGVEAAQVRAMIPSLLLPFNATKALFNAGVVMLLYKRLSSALRRVTHQKTVPMQQGMSRILLPLIAIGIIALAVCIFFLVLGGSAEIPLFAKE